MQILELVFSLPKYISILFDSIRSASLLCVCVCVCMGARVHNGVCACASVRECIMARVHVRVRVQGCESA